MEKGLTNKQEKFSQGVATNDDQSAAYRAAYNAKKMSNPTIWQQASRLMTNPKVAARIKELKAIKRKIADKKFSINNETLLRELHNWAFSDITQALNLTIEQLKNMPEEFRRLINKYKHTQRKIRNDKGKVVETIDTIELTFVSKEKAIDMIARHIGFYEEDNKQKVADLFDGKSLPELLDMRADFAIHGLRRA